MKTIKLYSILLAITFVFPILSSCEDRLEEKTFTVLSPNDFFNTGDDLEVVLLSVYGELRYSDITRDAVTLQEVNTDIAYERGGGIFTWNEPIEEFTWTTTHQWLQNSWERRYRGIFKANTVLDNADFVEMDEERRNEIIAEARFLRAFNYFLLYDFFGPVPLVTSSETEVTDRPERSSEEEMISFIENELTAAAQGLAVTPPQNQYGRPTRGAALGALTKFYMMTKKWQEAAATAKQVMDLGEYDLFIEADRTDLFSPDNQRDNEFIFVSVMSDTPDNTSGDGWLSHVVPRGYQWEFPPRQIFAAKYKIYTSFLDTFDPEDERLNAFRTEFVNTEGETIVLGEDNAITLKFPEYPNQDASRSSDDFPFIRYADILLSRSEALNEINGPNLETVDLLNMVREAAGVANYQVADFANTLELRDAILAERGWEFHTEALRRQDLIRHNKFIEMAIERSKPAQAFQVRYPIPQTEIERNPNLVQNEGY
jgi:hypothetical protein